MKNKYTKYNPNKYEAHQLVLGMVAPNTRVLDIGCASGQFAKELKKINCEVWGIDSNTEALKTARKFCEKTFDLDIDKEEKLPLPEKYFDYVLLLDVIEHLAHPEKILTAIKPHLRDGGEVIFSIPNVAHASIRLMLLEGKFRYEPLGIMDESHLHFYTRETISGMLGKHDYKVSQILPTNGMTKVPFLSKITDRFPAKWQYRLVKNKPELFSYQFIVRAKPDRFVVKPVKLMFINAIDTNKPLQTSLPPLSLGYLVSSLRSEFGDRIIYKIIDRDIESTIKRFRPDIVGITCVSQNYNFAIKYAKIAKKYRLPVLIGGTHVSVLPSSLTRDMDVAVIGEGEAAIKELLAVYLKKKSFPSSELNKLKGLAYWDKGKLARTGARPPIVPLDKIPLPARDLLKIEKCTHVFSSRGCPYRCVFCASSRFWNTTRFFSAENVVREIKELYENYGVREINFWDDLFIVSKERIKKIVALLEEEGLLGKIIFGCAVRSNLIDESMARLLRKMNVLRVSMGLESGNKRVLNYLKGESVNLPDHNRAIRIFRKYGIEPSASFIIGSPDESPEEIRETLKFIKDSKLRGFGSYVLTPLPGTPIWDYAKERGLVSEKMDWSRLDVEFEQNHEQAIILSEKLGKNELYDLYQEFAAEQRKRRFVDIVKHPMIIPRGAYHFLKDNFRFRI